VVSQRAHGIERGEGVGRQAGSGGESDDRGDGLGAGAEAELLAAAVPEGLKGEPFADGECADAFRGVELVAGDGDEVGAELALVDRDLSRGLDGVDVQQRAAGVG
jgi:hypothetical protein